VSETSPTSLEMTISKIVTLALALGERLLFRVVRNSNHFHTASGIGYRSHRPANTALNEILTLSGAMAA
jgi:hypothetical protein